MPQPIKNTRGLAAKGGPKVILERLEHAKLLGAITSVWGEVDNIFLDVFNLITFAKPIPIGAHSRSELSFAIFGSFISHKNKCEVIRKVLVIQCPEEVESFDAISQNILRKAKSRNALVHCSWNVCENFPDDLIAFEKDGKWIRYTVKDFKDTLERSIEVRNELNDFFVGLSGWLHRR